MPATKVTLTGGAFQDSEGNVLASGYLEFVLNQDASITGVGNIASGVTVKIQLGTDGNVLVNPAQLIWGNDQMLPANSYYRVTGYSAAGQRVWGPNNQQVLGSGVNFSLGSWVPNVVFSWTPPVQPLALQVNGTPNGSQVKLNLKNGSNVAITDDGLGGVTVAATVPAVTSLTTAKVSHQATVNTTVAPGAPTPTSWGLISLQNSATSQSIIPPTASTPNLWSQLSQGSANQAASFWYEATALVTSGILGTWLSRLGFSQGGVAVSSAILWFGLTDTLPAQVNTNQFNSATPAANIVGFRFVTGTDTHWMAVCQTGAVNHTLVDTGVTPDTATHIFGIQQSPSGTYNFYIDGVLKASITTNVPAGTLALFSFAYAMNPGPGAITTNTASVYWDSGF